MDDEIARRAVVDTWRVDADRFHASLFDEKLRDLLRQTGKMQIGNIAGLVGAEITFAIAPVCAPAQSSPVRSGHEFFPRRAGPQLEISNPHWFRPSAEDRSRCPDRWFAPRESVRRSTCLRQSETARPCACRRVRSRCNRKRNTSSPPGSFLRLPFPDETAWRSASD